MRTRRNPAFPIASAALLALICCVSASPLLAAGQKPKTADETPYVRSAEIGAGISRYTDGLGQGNGEFLRVNLVKEKFHSWMFETGRQERFGESAWGLGVSHTRTVVDALSLTAGLSSGTGDYLFPEYRFDFSIDQGVLKEKNLVLSVGYTRIQSKQENSSDGFGAGAVLWLPHWVLEARYLYDVGHPGDAVSKSWGLGATWYLYKKTYLGAGLSGGQVSYMLVGPAQSQALVDYDADGWHVGLQQWIWSDGGFNLRYEHGTTSYYQVDGYSVSVFKEF